MKTTCWIGLLLLSAGSVTFAQKEEAPRSRLQPLFDTVLRDASICKGGDNAWYLTSTAPDFQNNDGIHPWRSIDCQTWKEIGSVWSIERQGSAGQKQLRRVGEDRRRRVRRFLVHRVPGLAWQRKTRRRHECLRNDPDR
jgi:hypothetical protein